MRKIPYYAALGTGSLAMIASAWAQDADLASLYPPVVIPSQSSVYNQNSVYLPTPPIAHGQDIVRGASGLSCQTAVASGGAYVDIGLIGSQDVFNRDTAALYGRVVVPLGKRPDRPDCTKLYELEIARLSLELEMLRMGLPPGLSGAQQASTANTVVEPAAVSARPLVIEPRGAPTPERKAGAVNRAVPVLKPRNERRDQRPPAGPL